jgi:general secretion pathway protein H
MPPTSPAPTADGGFTLLELLVVLTLLAILSAAVLPRFMAGAAPSARDWAARAAHELRAARQTAIAAARPVRVPITADNARLRTFDGRAADAVMFFPDGGSSGGQITFEHRGRAAIVTVDDLTGAVRLHDG